eukprot:UN26588
MLARSLLQSAACLQRRSCLLLPHTTTISSRLAPACGLLPSVSQGHTWLQPTPPTYKLPVPMTTMSVSGGAFYHPAGTRGFAAGSKSSQRITKPKVCFYKMLNVSASADLEEIKNQYYKLAKKYHPDALSGQPEGEVEKSKELFKEITEAYAIL